MISANQIKLIRISFLFALFSLPISANCIEKPNTNTLKLELSPVNSNKVELKIANNGSNLAYIINLFASEYYMVRFVIYDSNNNIIQYTGVSAEVVFTRNSVVRLGKNSFVGKVKDLSNLEDYKDVKNQYITKKGKYRVYAIYEIPEDMKNEIAGVKLWTGKIISNEILIDVK